MDILFRVVFFRRSRRGGGESATDHPTGHLPVPARRLCGLLGRRHRPDAHVALLFAGKMTKRKKAHLFLRSLTIPFSLRIRTYRFRTPSGNSIGPWPAGWSASELCSDYRPASSAPCSLCPASVKLSSKSRPRISFTPNCMIGASFAGVSLAFY